MISVSQAQEAIITAITTGNEATVSLTGALGCVAAEDMYCPMDAPPFNQSGVDGYAFRLDNYKEDHRIHITGESSAGKSYLKELEPNQAVRIFTGAEVPVGADTIVMQEKTDVHTDLLIIHDEKIAYGANVRERGSHCKKGDLALMRGNVINAGTIGFLASIGIPEVKVFFKPSIAIIITGSELKQPGEVLGSGQVYESNSACLCAALQGMGINDVKVFYAADDESVTRAVFREALATADIVLFTGGISVGDYDYVGKVLREEYVSEIFYKVKQRPGKPLFFGKKDGHTIFGLPGNPASVLTCFYEYVYPAIRTTMGYTNPFLQSIRVPLKHQVNTIKGLTFFLKANTDYRTVTPLDGQPSYMMRSFASANCFIVVPEDVEQIDVGRLVDVNLLP